MKLKRYLAIFILAAIFFMAGLAPVSAQDEGLVSLLDKIVKRMDSYPENNNYKAMIITKNIVMDKNWQPKKTTTIKAILKAIDNEANTEILEAIEIEDGKTKDVTQKYIEQAEKQRKKAEKDAVEDNGEKQTEDPLTNPFPFKEDKRAKYNFFKLDDFVIDERPVCVIETKAKEKDEMLLEGKYYIDQRTLDILKIQIRYSKNPKFVKELDIDMYFEVLPGGYFVPKKSKTRVNGGMFFKRVRMIIEQDYFDYEILDSDAI